MVLIRPQGGSSGALGGALDGLDIDYDTFVLLLGIATAAAAFALYQIIVTKGRRKRSAIEDSSWWQSSVDRLSDFVWMGKSIAVSDFFWREFLKMIIRLEMLPHCLDCTYISSLLIPTLDLVFLTNFIEDFETFAYGVWAFDK